jgi:hypothetical protein
LRKNGLTALFTLVFGVVQLFASLPEDVDAIVNHLEFLGYTVTQNNEAIRAEHATNLSVFIRQYQGGLLVSAFFGGSDYGKSHKDAWLNLVNTLNEQATVARYYIDSDDDLAIEGYYPGSYRKDSFGVFLDNFNQVPGNIAELHEILEYIE